MRLRLPKILALLFALTGFTFAQSPPPPPSTPVSSTVITLPVLSQLQSVSSVAVQIVGNPGPQTIYYWIVANYTVGSAPPSGPFVTTSAPNTLSGSNYISIVPQYPAGVSSIDVLKTSSNAQPSGTCNCAVAIGVTSGAITDQSNSTLNYTVNPIDTTKLAFTLQNEVQSSGISHLILRQGGVFVADLSVATPAPPSPISFSVAPASINFGSVQAGGPGSDVQNLTLSNNSATQSVQIVSVSLSGSNDFLSTNLSVCNVILPAGQPCVVPFKYIPGASASGPEQATVTISTSAPNPFTATLSGTAVGGVTHSLVVTTTGSGAGITSDGGNISCPGQCDASYTNGFSVTLTPTANQGSTFVSFSGDCSGPTCNLTMNADHQVTVTYNLTPAIETLTVGGGGQGTGLTTSDLSDTTGNPISCLSTAGVLTGKCTGAFLQNSAPTLTATPSSSGTGTCVGASCTFGSFVGIPGCGSASATCGPFTLTTNTPVTVNYNAPTASAPFQIVQTNATSSTGTNSTFGTFSNAQTAGNTNIISVLWNDNTTTISSVTDSSGNVYTQASGTGCSPNNSAGLGMAIYYSIGIAAAPANTNKYTVAMSASPSFRVVWSEEVAGITAFDTCHGATGSGTSLDSGAFTTTAANDYLVGFDNVAHAISVVSSGYTSRIAGFGNDVEDIQNQPVGTYHFQPTQAPTGGWNATGLAFTTSGTAAPRFSFSVNIQGTGSATVTGGGISCPGTCSTSVAAGGTVTLNVSPASGTTFLNYQGAGCGTLPQCTTAAITTNTSVTVNISATTSCVGPWNITSQPPPSCPFYGQGANNVTNKRLPADVGSHGAVGGDTIAQTALAGNSIQFFTPGSDDRGVPLWYSRPTDPFYKSAGCPNSAFTNLPAFQAPSNSNSTDQGRPDIPANGDNNYRVWDQTSGVVYGAYISTSSATPYRIGTSNGTTAGAAVSVATASACGAAKNIFTDQDWGKPYGWLNGQGAEGSSGFAPMAGVVRSQELLQGQINHALILGVACTNAYLGSFHVFPSTLDTSHCSVATTMPPNGALLYLDYTDAQITALGLPAWQKTLVTAMAHYGGYVDITGNSAGTGALTFVMESPMVYQLQTGGTISAATNGLKVSGGTPDPITAFLVSQGFVYNGSSGTSTKTTPASWLPAGASSHIHMADPCIAQGYAGQTGGCF